MGRQPYIRTSFALAYAVLVICFGSVTAHAENLTPVPQTDGMCAITPNSLSELAFCEAGVPDPTCRDLAGTGCSASTVAISTTGNASSGVIAVSGTGDATACGGPVTVAESGTGDVAAGFAAIGQPDPLGPGGNATTSC
jgi:hypothetical protein